jgi:hypothetical protein
MNEIIQKPSRWLRWTLEFLFSLNLAWATVWVERVKTKVLGGHLIGYYVSTFIERVSRHATVSLGEGKTVLEQIVWSFALAMIVFLFLRLLGRFAVVTIALRYLAGAFAIAGFPIVVLQVPFGFIFTNDFTGVLKIGLILEVIVILTCGLFCFARTQLISVPLMVLLLFLHFAFWAHFTESYVNVPDLVRLVRDVPYLHPWSLGLWMSIAFHAGFPLIGLLTSVIWVYYVRRPSESSGRTAGMVMSSTQ